jgi:hypothetical protein
MEAKILYPTGDADIESVSTYSSTMTLTVDNEENIVTLPTLTGATTLSVTAGSELKKGAKLRVRATADGTNRVITFGTGITGAAFTVTASKTVLLSFIFSGNSFLYLGVGAQD